ncbi:MAG: Na+/H+ antiporter subunit E [Cyanobacteriota bacterium]
MTWLFTSGFRLLLWFLLTADASAANLLIGLALAMLLPRGRSARGPLRPLLAVLLRSLLAVPRAYAEALALMLAPMEREQLVTLQTRGLSSPLATFLDVFAITLTPFTIVLGLLDQSGTPSYRVHQVRPAGPADADPTENRR